MSERIVIGDATFYHGDCLEIMPELPEGSVDAIIVDPPYGTINGANLDGWKNRDTNWDKILDQKPMLSACNDMLRVNGALVMFCQDPYTGKLMTETHGNLPLSYRMTWIKDHFANALIAKKAPVGYTEDVCVFFKKYDTLAQHPLRDYSKLIMDFIRKSLKEINNDLGHRRAEHFFYIESTQFSLCTGSIYIELINMYGIDAMLGFKTYDELTEIDRRFNRRFNLPEGKKYKSNVLKYGKDYTGFHPTQKPINLMIDLIKTYTNNQELVLDFAMGSGTTAIACYRTGRKFIGIEKEKKYFDIAVERYRREFKQLRLADIRR